MGLKIALVGAELEENLALRYMAATLEGCGHEVRIVSFNQRDDLQRAVDEVIEFDPQITGVSMIFTLRAEEFCDLATAIRARGYLGHIIAGGPFASFACRELLERYTVFDSVALGEGEYLMCELAENLHSLGEVGGLCYRDPSGKIITNKPSVNPQNLDALPFPKRTTFFELYGKRFASILSSRGCWRSCAFCSINAWYSKCKGKVFRTRSVENIVEEMCGLYFNHNVRVFNFQDDNFFLPDRRKALARFDSLRKLLARCGVKDIAIAVKARPDSITRDSISILSELGLFRVFLGVENASVNGLKNLDRVCDVDTILSALQILNDFDVHVAFNLLMFEPYATLGDILTNLRFMERHIDNPMNFCRAEVYPGTGLEQRLSGEGNLRGGLFGLDYTINDPRVQALHEIANHAFFDRNFNDKGLHYFNMQVDFIFHFMNRFHPELIVQKMRAESRDFIKRTNLDTYECLCEIYDYVSALESENDGSHLPFAEHMRSEVDRRGKRLHAEGQRLLAWFDRVCLGETKGGEHLFHTRPERGNSIMTYDAFREFLNEAKSN